MRFLSVIAGIVCASAAFAQSDRGSLTGTIADPAGAVVANAAIQVKNTENGAIYDGGTSATGNFTIPVPTGTYDLKVAVPGFKTYVRQGILVPVAQDVRADITLEVGASTDSITVQAESPLLKTESGEISHNVEIDRLNALPLFRASTSVRNPYSVATVLPGMTATQATNSFQNPGSERNAVEHAGVPRGRSGFHQRIVADHDRTDAA
jgi:hypothetical protein